MTRIPDDVTLTLHQVKFPEETPGTSSVRELDLAMCFPIFEW